MPLYLVRWPTIKVSLIKATDEQDLLNTIDEIDDSSGCTWKIYKGPLHLDFDLGINFEDKSDYKSVPFKPSVKIEASDESREIYQYAFQKNDSDTITNMWDEVTQMAFPHLWAYYFNTKPKTQEQASLKQEFEKAILAELQKFYELEFICRFPESDKPFERN
jgi:hypothetical protein